MGSRQVTMVQIGVVRKYSWKLRIYEMLDGGWSVSMVGRDTDMAGRLSRMDMT